MLTMHKCVRLSAEAHILSISALYRYESLRVLSLLNTTLPMNSSQRPKIGFVEIDRGGLLELLQ